MIQARNVRVCASCILLSSLALAQQPATAPPPSHRLETSTGRNDQQIQQEAVKIVASKDKWKGVTPSTEDGIVSLEGAVKLYIDKADLARKVDKIKKVEGVRNHVQVEGNVPDAELRQTLSDKLAYDRIGYGIMFNNLTLDVKDGVAAVGGDVRDYPSRDSALAIVEATPGVKDVIDNINVLPASTFDDDLRLRIARTIYGDPSLRKYALSPLKPIRIIVDNGHVTLEGVVDSQLDKQLAVSRANAVPNVFSVTDNLMVGSQTGK